MGKIKEKPEKVKKRIESVLVRKQTNQDKKQHSKQVKTNLDNSVQDVWS